MDVPPVWLLSAKVAVPLPWPSVPEPETATLHCAGAILSDRLISPSKLPPTEATFKLSTSRKRSSPSGIMSLQPGMHFFSTAGSLSAFHSVSIGTSKSSSPPMSSFIAHSFDLEQPRRQSAIDRSGLLLRNAGVGDDAHRLAIADRERHVGAHHQALRSHHLDHEFQHAHVVQDGVGVDSAKSLDRIADAGGDLVVALEAAQHEGQGGGAHRGEDFRILVA